MWIEVFPSCLWTVGRMKSRDKQMPCKCSLSRNLISSLLSKRFLFALYMALPLKATSWNEVYNFDHVIDDVFFLGPMNSEEYSVFILVMSPYVNMLSMTFLARTRCWIHHKIWICICARNLVDKSILIWFMVKSDREDIFKTEHSIRV